MTVVKKIYFPASRSLPPLVRNSHRNATTTGALRRVRGRRFCVHSSGTRHRSGESSAADVGARGRKSDREKKRRKTKNRSRARRAVVDAPPFVRDRFVVIAAAAVFLSLGASVPAVVSSWWRRLHRGARVKTIIIVFLLFGGPGRRQDTLLITGNITIIILYFINRFVTKII